MIIRKEMNKEVRANEMEGAKAAECAKKPQLTANEECAIKEIAKQAFDNLQGTYMCEKDERMFNDYLIVVDSLARSDAGSAMIFIHTLLDDNDYEYLTAVMAALCRKNRAAAELFLAEFGTYAKAYLTELFTGDDEEDYEEEDEDGKLIEYCETPIGLKFRITIGDDCFEGEVNAVDEEAEDDEGDSDM